MNDDVVRVARTDSARTALVLPRLIVDAGPAAVEKFLEFFAARIANRRTRAAYGRAVGQFLAWCAARGLGLTAVVAVDDESEEIVNRSVERHIVVRIPGKAQIIGSASPRRPRPDTPARNGRNPR